MNTGLWSNDVLLFDTQDIRLTPYNKPPFLKRKVKVVQHHLDFWTRYNSQGLPTTGARLKSIPNLKFNILTTKFSAAMSRKLGMSLAVSDYMTIFDDDDAIHPERNRYLRTVFETYPELQIIIHATRTMPLTPLLYDKVIEWRDMRFENDIDPPSIGWKDAIEYSDLIPRGHCPDAPNTVLEHPKPYAGHGQDERYDRWQAVWYHYSNNPKGNIPVPANRPLIYLNETDQYYPIVEEAKNSTRPYIDYHLGPMTIRRDLFNKYPPLEYQPDETVFYGWSVMTEVCAKVGYFPSQLGCYLQKRLWAYTT